MGELVAMNRYRVRPLELCGVLTDGVEFQLLRCVWRDGQYINLIYTAYTQGNKSAEMERAVAILAHMILTTRDVYHVCTGRRA